MTARFSIAFWGLVAAQVLVLVAMVGFSEQIRQTGERVVLQTVPVDPRSLLQGDYAILNYELAIPGRVETANPPLPHNLPNRSLIYVTLERQGDIWQATGYHRKHPRYQATNNRPGQPFIRGFSDDTGRLDFGIGTYFVPEGTGHIVERAGDVKVIARVDPDGNAAITGLLVDGVSFEEALKNEQGNR